MTKYSFTDKSNVVAKYKNMESISQISREIGISRNSIVRWIAQYNVNGIDGLRVRHCKKTYDIEFKKRVIDYYLNSLEGTNQVAAHFDISHSQLYMWNKLFQKYGLVGLKPSPKGRPRKLNSKKNKSVRKSKVKLPLTEKEKYEEEILKLKSKLRDYELKYDILKTIAQMEKDGRIGKNQRS